MLAWTDLLLLFATGAAAGTLNVVAGGGSFLTLPVLIFLGLPAVEANGTNRVAIAMQNTGAVWGFRRHGVLDLRALSWAAAPATVGAVLGAWLALVISDEAFTRILAFLMVALSLWTLWAPKPKTSDPAPPDVPPRRALLALGFFGTGIYGGFVQAGVGFLVLAVTTAAGLDLVRGNAVKVLAILCLTAISLTIFAAQGKVHWLPGLALGAGAVVGGLLGVRLTIRKGHRWIRRIVTLTVIAFAIKLWLGV